MSNFILMKMVEIGATPRGMRKALNAARKAVWAMMAKHWFVFIRPKHFTGAGAREYDYRERSPKYKLMKRKKFGHNKPLVKTGESERSVRFSGRIIATKDRGRVSMTARKLNWSGGWLRDELTRFSKRDVATLTNVGDRGLGKQFKQLRRRRTIRMAGPGSPAPGS